MAGFLILLRLYALLGVEDVDVSSIASTAAEIRVQEQLVPLYGEVRRFSWARGRLPSNLAEAHGSDPIDVVTGRPFTFEPRPDGSFRIFSIVEGLGDVGLTYKPTARTKQIVPPPGFKHGRPALRA